MITVVGMGVEKDDITLKGAEAVKNADVVLVKTALTPTYDYFTSNGIEAEPLDFIYEKAKDFDELDKLVSDYVVKSSSGKNLVYCVNGAGPDDRSVSLIKSKAETRIICAPSADSYARRVFPFSCGQSYAAYDLAGKSVFLPDKSSVLTVREIDNKFVASEIKLLLSDAYGENFKIILINGKNTCEIPLYELDRQKKYGWTTTALFPPVSFKDSERFTFSELLEILDGLLAEDGCPWDRAQTHESIRKNVIEEAYELVDAVDRQDTDGIVEETGDVILQAVFNAAIGNKLEEYNVGDALTGLCRKLLSRHPHVFGDVKAADAAEALKSWEGAKAKEKHYLNQQHKIDLLPKNLPALMYAYKVQKYAAKDGFEFACLDDVRDKLYEEAEELGNAAPSAAEDEAGDLLFAAVNLLRWLDVEPETALRKATSKFLKRYKYVCDYIARKGGDLKDTEFFDRVWDEAKKAD